MRGCSTSGSLGAVTKRERGAPVKTQAKKGSNGPVRHSLASSAPLRPAESQGAAASAIALPLGSVFGAEGPSPWPAPVAAHHFFPLLLLPCDAARSSAQGLQPQDENKNPVRFHSEPHRVCCVAQGLPRSSIDS
jgi:hypothetical protein